MDISKHSCKIKNVYVVSNSEWWEKLDIYSAVQGWLQKAFATGTVINSLFVLLDLLLSTSFLFCPSFLQSYTFHHSCACDGGKIHIRTSKPIVTTTMTKSSIKIADKNQAQDVLQEYDNFLFDCDGVIWLDSQLIPGVKEFLNILEKNNKGVAFVTNNSSVSREGYLKKFQKLGLINVAPESIFPTSYAATVLLERDIKLERGSKVWVLGDEGIIEELHAAGYIPVGGNDKRLDEDWDPNHPLLDVDEDVKAVVVGSTKKLNYLRISATLQYLLHNNKSIPFLGTNIDRSYPGPGGRILPAGGSVVNYMAYTADREPINVGKPSQVLLDLILKERGFDAENTLMTGDTMYTDIKFGNDGGLGSLLVLSGGTKQRDFDNVDTSDASVLPRYYIQSLGHLQELL